MIGRFNVTDPSLSLPHSDWWIEMAEIALTVPVFREEDFSQGRALGKGGFGTVHAYSRSGRTRASDWNESNIWMERTNVLLHLYCYIIIQCNEFIHRHQSLKNKLFFYYYCIYIMQWICKCDCCVNASSTSTSSLEILEQSINIVLNSSQLVLKVKHGLFKQLPAPIPPRKSLV